MLMLTEKEYAKQNSSHDPWLIELNIMGVTLSYNSTHFLQSHFDKAFSTPRKLATIKHQSNKSVMESEKRYRSWQIDLLLLCS